MAAFYRPSTLSEALEVLAREPVTIAAGCTDLFPATEARRLEGPVLDVTSIEALRGITRDSTGVRIGATVTWTDVIKANLPPSFDMLKEAAREVGSVQIQNSGTVAGNLCNASPAADGAPCLMSLDAEIEVESVKGQRRLQLWEFVTGPRQIALAQDEMVTAIHIPEHALGGRSKFLKLGARKYLIISIAMVALRFETDAGVVKNAAISVGACSAAAQRLYDVETSLVGLSADKLSASLDETLIAKALSPIDDIRADAAYRSAAAAELIRRALDELSALSEKAA